MTDSNFVGKGVDIIRDAVALDKEGKLEEALATYKKGLEYLMTGRKYEKNEKTKAVINTKVLEYMKRAEEIKEQLNRPKKKAVKQKQGGNSDSDDGDSKDPENEKMKGALSSAIVSVKPNVAWDDVAGLDTAKGLLKEAVILPIKFPQLFVGKRTPWRGILLYGPPGTGKSYLAKAVATEADSVFFSVSSSDLVTKFQGESERLVKNLFAMAREQKPSIIFIDEIDSLCGNRTDGENDSVRRIKTEFLVQMQGVGSDNEGVLVLGATNTPWDLDPAIRRRFEKRIYIPLPEEAARATMFKVHIGSTPHTLSDSDFPEFAKITEGLSGSDISNVVRDALMEPIRTLQTATHFKKVKDATGKRPFLLQPCSPDDPEGVEMTLMEVASEDLSPMDVSAGDFYRVCADVKASVGPAEIKRYIEWTAEFGQEG